MAQLQSHERVASSGRHTMAAAAAPVTASDRRWRPSDPAQLSAMGAATPTSAPPGSHTPSPAHSHSGSRSASRAVSGARRAGSGSGTAAQTTPISTPEQGRSRSIFDDSEVSPGSQVPGRAVYDHHFHNSFSAARQQIASIAPWEISSDDPGPLPGKMSASMSMSMSMPGPGSNPGHRRMTSASTGAGINVGSALREAEQYQPTSFFNADADENSFITGLEGTQNGALHRSPADQNDRRRPSGASYTTISSGGSRSSIGRSYQKRFRGIFGDELPDPVIPAAGSNGGSGGAAAPDRPAVSFFTDHFSPHRTTTREGSLSSRPPSPRTTTGNHPGGWERNGSEQSVGLAPSLASSAASLRGRLSRRSVESGRPSVVSKAGSLAGSIAGALSPMGHRYSRSKEEGSRNASGSGSSDMGRPKTAREGGPVRSGLRLWPDTSIGMTLPNLPQMPAMPTQAMQPAGTPTPAATFPLKQTGSENGRNGSGSSTLTVPRRSLFDKIRRREKDEKPRERESEGSRATLPRLGFIKRGSDPRSDNDGASTSASFGASNVFGLGSTLAFGDSESMGGAHGSMPVTEHYLDTDLSCIDDIVNMSVNIEKTIANASLGLPGFGPGLNAGANGGPPGEVADRLAHMSDADAAAASWAAPDSWAVRKDEETSPSREETASTEDEAGGKGKDKFDLTEIWPVRVFRPDATFATVSTPLDSSVADVMGILARKAAIDNVLVKYQFLMQRFGMTRPMQMQERPLLILYRLLMHCGYTLKDRLDEVMREANAHPCRFLFLPNSLGGYSGPEGDALLEEKWRGNEIDLSGTELVTIPLQLYPKANDVIRMDLSRNVLVDVPIDFIQSCGRLKALRITGCELKRLPAGVAEGTRMTLLDISWNRLTDLPKRLGDNAISLTDVLATDNRFSFFPSALAALPNLTRLSLRGNSISDGSLKMSHMMNLQDLDLSWNQVHSVSNLACAPQLRRLNLAGNAIAKDGLHTLSRATLLSELNLSGTGVESLECLTDLKCLQILHARDNRVGSVADLRSPLIELDLSSNPLTSFILKTSLPTLTRVNISDCGLAMIGDGAVKNMINLVELNAEGNYLVSLPPSIRDLRQLRRLNLGRNKLTQLPAEIGDLDMLMTLDIRANYLDRLPSEIWMCRNLRKLNVSANVLASIPRLPQRIINAFGGDEMGTMAGSLKMLVLADNQLTEDSLEAIGSMRQLRVLNLSYNSLLDLPPRLLRNFDKLEELYLSGNELSTVPSDDLDALSQLQVLLLNGNKLQVLPAEICKLTKLAVMDVGSNALKYNVNNWPYDWNWNWNRNLVHLNMSGNTRLEIKPAASFRGSVAPGTLHPDSQDPLELMRRVPTDFSTLRRLRLLGLMDVTLMVDSLPDQTDERRVRTAGSSVGPLPYGISDWLGRSLPSLLDQNDKSAAVDGRLNQFDLVVPRFRSRDDESLVGLFEGDLDHDMISDSSLGEVDGRGGARIAKFLHERFGNRFLAEIDRLRASESVLDAFRRTFLGLNREIAAAVEVGEPAVPSGLTSTSALPVRLTRADRQCGASATVLYFTESYLYIAHVGSVSAMLVQSDGTFRFLSKSHTIVNAAERERIRNFGGFVGEDGRVNDVSKVTRCFGRFLLAPAVIAAPAVLRSRITEKDELVIVASDAIWSRVPHQLIADSVTAHQTRRSPDDMPGVAQRLRDLALAFGERGQVMVMAVGLAAARRRQDGRLARAASVGWQGRTANADMVSATLAGYTMTRRMMRRKKPGYVDLSSMSRIGVEVSPPIVDVSLVFTDIKNSTALWEAEPQAMQAAIRLHNDIMRREIRLLGGYEVKTEGDAFMVAFPTVTSAILWCLTVQDKLLWLKWPKEILESPICKEVYVEEKRLVGTPVHNDYTHESEDEVGQARPVLVEESEATSFEEAIAFGVAAAVQAGSLPPDHAPQQFVRKFLRLETPTPRAPDGYPGTEFNTYTVKHTALRTPRRTMIYRGLSVRMGIHFGTPVCETDPTTRRMDYFGPVVNRAARVSGLADGGQISVSTDFVCELQRLLDGFIEAEKARRVVNHYNNQPAHLGTGPLPPRPPTPPSGSLSTPVVNAHVIETREKLSATAQCLLDPTDELAMQVRSEIHALALQGFDIAVLGERRLKGLENPEFIYLVHSLNLMGRMDARLLSKVTASSNPPLIEAVLEEDEEEEEEESVEKQKQKNRQDDVEEESEQRKLGERVDLDWDRERGRTPTIRPKPEPEIVADVEVVDEPEPEMAADSERQPESETQQDQTVELDEDEPLEQTRQVEEETVLAAPEASPRPISNKMAGPTMLVEASQTDVHPSYSDSASDSLKNALALHTWCLRIETIAMYMEGECTKAELGDPNPEPSFKNFLMGTYKALDEHDRLKFLGRLLRRIDMALRVIRIIYPYFEGSPPDEDLFYKAIRMREENMREGLEWLKVFKHSFKRRMQGLYQPGPLGLDGQDDRRTESTLDFGQESGVSPRSGESQVSFGIDGQTSQDEGSKRRLSSWDRLESVTSANGGNVYGENDRFGSGSWTSIGSLGLP